MPPVSKFKLTYARLRHVFRFRVSKRSYNFVFVLFIFAVVWALTLFPPRSPLAITSPPHQSGDITHLAALIPQGCPMIYAEIMNQNLRIILTRPWYETRGQSVIKTINDTLKAHIIPDVRFIVHLGDDLANMQCRKVVTSTNSKLIFAFTKKISRGLFDLDPILIPDWSFGSYPEVNIDSYESKWISLLNAGRENGLEFEEWDKRKARLFWRGAVHANRDDYVKLTDSIEGIDVQHSYVLSQQQFVPLEEHCRYKYLMHLNGRKNFWSTRFKFLFPCGSLLFWAEPLYMEFWYDKLIDKVNYVKVGSPSDLKVKFKYYQDNKKRAHQIAMNGVELGKELSYEFVIDRWRDVFVEFSEKQILE